MKIISINLGLFGSTGKIMYALSQLAKQEGYEALMVYPSLPQNMLERNEDLRLQGIFNRKLNSVLQKITGRNGCFCYRNTRQVLRYLKKNSPDILHLHNIHTMKINHRMLFNYIKKSKVKVIWTLHDCWSFTGQCAHFTMAHCDKWQTGCFQCPQYKEYFPTYVDNTKTMWELKKKWFTGVEDMTLVTPSQWLADLVKQSFLKEYPVQVIHNGIDLSVFQPTESDFRKKYRLENKFIVLGVAFGWGVRKGLDVFIELAKTLNERYQIVLVGADDNVDKQLPSAILSIHRTNNQRELAEIYTAADVFVNPTREEVLGLVNIEALACGTPVVTFNAGGSPETMDETCGCVVDVDDVAGMERGITRICEKKPYSQEACLQKARSFDKEDRFKEYIALYKRANE